MNSRSEWLGDLVRRLTESVDEAECFYTKEKQESVKIDHATLVGTSELESHHLYITSIHRGRMSRLSLSTSDAQDFERMATPDFIVPQLKGDEPAKYELNSGDHVPLENSAWNANTSVESLRDICDQYLQVLERHSPDLRRDIRLTLRSQEHCLANNRGLMGHYASSHFRSVFRFFSQQTNKINYLSHLGLETADEIMARCAPYMEVVRSTRPVHTIKKGVSALVLSPWVVNTVAQLLLPFLRADVNDSPWLLDLCPDEFELLDDPFIPNGHRSAPFDDEGTPTKLKTLIGRQKIQSKMSDLELSASLRSGSSGNGFRQGRFLERSSDVCLTVAPSNLRVAAGKISLREAIAENNEIVVVDQWAMPFSQLAQQQQRVPILSFGGRVYREGRYVADIRMMGIRELHQLFNSRAIPLAEGERTNQGWFPYFLLPEMKW